MTHAIGRTEWNRIADSLDGSVHHHNAQQNRLFRLFQALREENLDECEKCLRDGAPLDVPLILQEELGGSPRASKFQVGDIEGLVSITALGYAAGRGDLDQVKWLLRRGASVSSPFAQGRDAAWLAMEMEQPAILSFLLERGAPVNKRLNTPDERTRLIDAVMRSDLDSVEILLTSKAKVAFFDTSGKTALHHNFAKDPYEGVDLEIGRRLIDWGGNPAVVDLQGQAARDLAHSDVQYALLKQHGLEKSFRKFDDKVIPVQRTPSPEDEPAADEVFDPKDIIRPEAGEPGIPQLNKVPVFK